MLPTQGRNNKLTNHGNVNLSSSVSRQPDKSPKITFDSQSPYKSKNNGKQRKKLDSKSSPAFSEFSSKTTTNEMATTKHKSGKEANHGRVQDYLNNKRRNEILETFIRETEEKYQEFSSVKNGNVIELHDDDIFDGAKLKSDKHGTSTSFRSNTPRSVAFEMPPVMIDSSRNTRLEEVESNRPFSPLLSKPITDAEISPRTSKRTSQKHPRINNRSNSVENKYKVQIKEKQGGHYNDHRLKTVLGELGKRRRQGHLDTNDKKEIENTEISNSKDIVRTRKQPNTKQEPQTNTYIHNGTHTNMSQSSDIIFSTNDSKDIHTSVFVDPEEVEECHKVTNTLVVNCGANNGHNNTEKENIIGYFNQESTDNNNNKASANSPPKVNSGKVNTNYGDRNRDHFNLSDSGISLNRQHRRQQSDSFAWTSKDNKYQSEGSSVCRDTADISPGKDSGFKSYKTSSTQGADITINQEKKTVAQRSGFDNGLLSGNNRYNRNRITSGNTNHKSIEIAVINENQIINTTSSNTAPRNNSGNIKAGEVSFKCIDHTGKNNSVSGSSCLDNSVGFNSDQLTDGNGVIINNSISNTRKTLLKKDNVGGLDNTSRTVIGITDSDPNCVSINKDHSVDNNVNNVVVNKDGISHTENDKQIRIRDTDSNINVRLSPYKEPRVRKSRTESKNTELAQRIISTSNVDNSAQFSKQVNNSSTNTTKNNPLETGKERNVIKNSRKLLSERLKQNANINVLPNKGVDSISPAKKRFSSKSHDSFHEQSKKIEEKTPTSPKTHPISTENLTVKTPPLTVNESRSSSNTQSSRSVYLSSQSCENFSNFGKNDFKAALQRLKQNTDKATPSPVIGPTPSPILSGKSLRNKFTPTKGLYPSNVETLYDISETPVSQNEYNSECGDRFLPSCLSSVISFESDIGSGNEDHRPRIKQPRQLLSTQSNERRLTRPYLASSPQENPASPLPAMRENTILPDKMMPSYGAPLRLKPPQQQNTVMKSNSQTIPDGNNTFKYGGSSGINPMLHSRSQIDVGMLSLHPSPAPGKVNGARGQLISKSTSSFVTSTPYANNNTAFEHHPNTSNNVVRESNERPRTGRGNRIQTVKTYENTIDYNIAGIETESLFSEESFSTSSSQHSENNTYQSYQNTQQNVMPQHQQIAKNLPRPKSSKGRGRQSLQSDAITKSYGHIDMTNSPISNKERKTSVFNITVPKDNFIGHEHIQANITPGVGISHDKPPIGSVNKSSNRPKSSKGRTRHIPQDRNAFDSMYDSNSDNRNGVASPSTSSIVSMNSSFSSESTANVSQSKARPKSSKGRARQITSKSMVMSEIGNTSELTNNDSDKAQLSKFRPKSAKGRTRDITESSPQKPNNVIGEDCNGMLIKRDKVSLSVDKLPVDKGNRGKKAQRNQHRGLINSLRLDLNTITSEKNSVTGNKKRDKLERPSSARKDKYFKPQTEFEPDSGNDTDVDGEIEILDLDKLDAEVDSDSDDFPVSLPRTPVIGVSNVRNPSGYTDSSRSSHSETSNAAWDTVVSDHYGNRKTQHMSRRRQPDNKGVHDACPPDTPRLTPKELAVIKSNSYETINKGNKPPHGYMNTAMEPLETATATHNNVKAENNFDMQKAKKSSIAYEKYETIDSFNGPSRFRKGGDVSSMPKQYPSSNVYPDANNTTADEKFIAKYRQRVLSDPLTSQHLQQQQQYQQTPLNQRTVLDSVIHRDKVGNNTRKDKVILKQQARKLQPLQSLGSFERLEMASNSLTYDTPLYSQSTSTFQRFAAEGNINNCNSSAITDDAYNSTSIGLNYCDRVVNTLGGIPTRAQKVRNGKSPKVKKPVLSNVYNNNNIEREIVENSDSPFDSCYSDSPGYLTDGSSTFEYKNVGRKMSGPH